jgi:hypothetical protein
MCSLTQPQKLGVPVDAALVERVIAAEGDAAVELLTLLHEFIHRQPNQCVSVCRGGGCAGRSAHDSHSALRAF